MNTFSTTTRIIHLIGLSILCAVAVGCKDGQLSTKERDAAKAVLKELNRLRSYSEAGINYQEYQSRVLDAKGEIDNHLLDIQSGPIKDALKDSLRAPNKTPCVPDCPLSVLAQVPVQALSA